jgi:hypothetical protein
VPPKKPTNRRRIRPRWGRIALVVVIALLICGGGALIAGRILLSMATSDVAQLQIPGNEAMVNGHVLDGPLNLLLVGIDDGKVTGLEDRGTTDARADSI